MHEKKAYGWIIYGQWILTEKLALSGPLVVKIENFIFFSKIFLMTSYGHKVTKIVKNS